MKKTYFIALVFIIGVISCGKDSTDTLDDALMRQLDYASQGEGVDFFILPDSDDLEHIPQDPNNPLSQEKITLGKNLFHETAFGTEGMFPITVNEFSCATCHHAGAGFQAGIAQGLGEGGMGFGIRGETRTRNLLCAPELCDVQPLRSPTILNGAFQPLMLWSGQFGATDLNVGTESQWTEGTPKAVNALGFEGLETQAIAGLSVHRMSIDPESVEMNGYKTLFDAAFPDVPTEERYTLTTAGLAIAAYERTVMSHQAPFQKYLHGDFDALTDYQKQGAILFFGKANCSSCHTGPALNEMAFHALGMSEFNLADVTHYNPEDPARFGRFAFTKREEDKFLFKTPQLYNLKGIEFLGHGASFRSVEDVVRYKNIAVPQNPEVPVDQIARDFMPLGLNDTEIDRLVDFIENGLYDPTIDRYVPEETVSGLCFPNNDPTSQDDLGCN